MEGGVVSRLLTFEVGQVCFLSSLNPCIPTISLTEELSNFQNHRYQCMHQVHHQEKDLFLGIPEQTPFILSICLYEVKSRDIVMNKHQHFVTYRPIFAILNVFLFQQFIIGHPPCSSYIQSSPVKVLAVIQERRESTLNSYYDIPLQDNQVYTNNTLIPE